MQIGYFAVGIGPTVDPEWVRTIATTAERLGFSTIWAPEHVVLLEQYASKYPYSSGDFPAPTDTPIADPFTTLAYAAACTTRIRLATGICLVPEHNPLVLAKTVATVDRLSDGRFTVGVGVGLHGCRPSARWGRRRALRAWMGLDDRGHLGTRRRRGLTRVR
jgi:alkanesulfonate monooxygenase SsuD/methylene tetrahydromethanopterin reductase-like flavin-dependent oxidoreductase (luciferase family)